MRIRLSLSFLFIFFLAIISFQCQKEISGTGGSGNNGGTIAAPAPITATVQGIITDENDQPATGVAITVGSKTSTTDSKGFFRILKASLDKNAALVVAEKTGYFKALRSFPATSGANHVAIKLVKKNLAGTITAASGGEVSLANGSKVKLSAGGVIVKSSGASFSGTVNVYAAYIDPTSPDISRTVPGSLMADNKDGKRVVLSSFGMMAVELESAAGEKLQLASGKPATLTMPVPASLAGTAPASIPLWYVDEQTGLWKEEGTATKNGNVYTGEVTHFSFWNCDVPANWVNLTLTLKNNEGGPLVHSQVKLTRAGATGWNASAYGWTDSLGTVSGAIPANEALLLEVMDNCNNPVFSQNIGPFATATNLGTITVTAPVTSMVTIKGKVVNCGGAAVTTNGYAIVNYDNIPRYLSLNSNGEFSFSVLRCATSPATLDATGVDNTAQQQGTVTGVNVTTPVTDIGSIAACGTSATQFFNYTVNGVSYSLSSAVLSDSLMGTSFQQGATPYYTNLSGFSASPSKQIGISFTSPAAAGTYPLTSIYAQSTSGTIFPSPSTVTLTNFPATVGGFYEGSFTATYKDSSAGAPVHTASGTFRLRRN